MSLPPNARCALTPREVEFVAEAQSVMIVPARAFPGSLHLLCGSFGPFRPPLKAAVPLWLALALKRRGMCSIVPPPWLDPEYLEHKLDEERSSEAFAEMDFAWLETAMLLSKQLRPPALSYRAQDDIPHHDQIKKLLKSIKDCRESKTQKGVKLMNVDLFSQGFLNLDNLGLMEVNEIKPFFTRAFDEMGRFSGLLTRDDGKGGMVTD
ncbi:DNA replication protein psf2 [Entophlyctis luteolus]|nr:DNA replication protein psf2 [Entophlyctis luteolus]